MMTAVLLFIAVIPFAIAMSILFAEKDEQGHRGGLARQAVVFAVIMLLGLAATLVYAGLLLSPVV